MVNEKGSPSAPDPNAPREDELPGAGSRTLTEAEVPSQNHGGAMAAAGGRQMDAGEQSPMAMLNAAISHGYGPETIQQLMSLAKEWDQWQAQRAYYHAMSAFRANAPVLQKDKQVKFRDSNGNWVEYAHVKLPTIVKAVSEVMAPLGLSFRWQTSQLEGGAIRVDCIVRHEDGYEESTGLQAGVDTSGKKNSIQGIGSTVRYLQRYTLEAMTGIVPDDPRVDDDGASGGSEADAERQPGDEFLTDQQCADYRAVFEELGLGEDKVCNTYGILKLEDLRQKAVPDLDRRLKNRRAAQGKERAQANNNSGGGS